MKRLMNTTIFIAFFCLSMKPVEGKKPDLRIVKIEVEYENGSLIKVTVENTGLKATKATTLKIWDIDFTQEELENSHLTPDERETIEENIHSNPIDKYYELEQEVATLKPSEAVTIEFHIPGHWIYDPNCEVGAFIDNHNNIKEEREDNNKAFYIKRG